MTCRHLPKANVSRIVRRAAIVSSLLGVVLGASAAQSQTLDQCITSDVAPAIISTRPQMKFFPGHYVHIGQRKEAGYFTTVLNEIKAPDSGIRGIMRRYTWSDLEPSENNYSGITQLEYDLRDAEANGKKIFPIIQYKYTSLYNGVSVPKYIRDKGTKYYFNIKGGLGTVPNWGESYVRQRFLILLKQLAVKFDSRPGLAGIAFNETSASVDFNPASLRDGYFLGMIKMDKGAACLFRQTPVMQLTNHPKEHLAAYDTAFRSHAIAMGAPDVFSKVVGDQFYTAGFSYDFMMKLDNVVPRGALVAEKNMYYKTYADELDKRGYQAESEATAVNRIYNIANNDLKVNYIFWHRTQGTDSYYLAIKAKAKATANSLRSACPSLYSAGGCKMN